MIFMAVVKREASSPEHAEWVLEQLRLHEGRLLFVDSQIVQLHD